MKYWANIYNKMNSTAIRVANIHWRKTDTSVRNIFKNRLINTVTNKLPIITAFQFTLLYNSILTGYQLDFFYGPCIKSEVFNRRVTNPKIKLGALVLMNNLHAYKEIITFIKDPRLMDIIDTSIINNLWTKLNHLSSQDLDHLFHTLTFIRFWLHMNNTVNVFLPHNLISLSRFYLDKNDIKLMSLFRLNFSTEDSKNVLISLAKELNIKIDFKHVFFVKLMGIWNNTSHGNIFHKTLTKYPEKVLKELGNIVYNKIFFDFNEVKYNMNQILNTDDEVHGIIMNPTIIEPAVNLFWKDKVEPIIVDDGGLADMKMI